MTKYVRNEEGGVHSVTDEHFEKVLHTTTKAGNTFLLPGWTEITEAEAKKAHPQLFGVPDPNVYLSDEEAARAATREKALRELRGEGDPMFEAAVDKAVKAALAAMAPPEPEPAAKK